MTDKSLAEQGTQIQPRRHFLLETAIVSVFAVVVGVLIAAAVYRSTLLYSFNSNEGWNATITKNLIDGDRIYYPLGGVPFTNNYPPLSFVIVGLVSYLIHDAVFAGRLIATGAFIAVIAIIVAIVERVEQDTVAALTAGLTFAALMLLNSAHYVGANDPQMLAHAVMLLGLYVSVRRPPGWWSSVLAAVLISVGLFIKHNPIALPIALAFWLFAYDRPSFIRFALTGTATALFGLVACMQIFGPVFVASLLLPRAYSLGKAQRDLIWYLTPIKLSLMLTVLPVALRVENRWTWLFVLYAATAIAICALSAAGFGVGSNAAFEVIIAVALTSGHVVSRIGTIPGPRMPALRVWVLASLFLSALLSPGVDAAKDIFMQPRVWLADLRAKQAENLRVVDAIAAIPGVALCQNLVYCYWAGKLPSGDLFNFSSALKGGVVSDAAFVQKISNGNYGVIELQNLGSMSENMIIALRTRYRLLQNGPGSVFLYVKK
jgi:Dolichyl-phosphate-mannose-protein mannosyltransferase